MTRSRRRRTLTKAEGVGGDARAFLAALDRFWEAIVFNWRRSCEPHPSANRSYSNGLPATRTSTSYVLYLQYTDNTLGGIRNDRTKTVARRRVEHERLVEEVHADEALHIRDGE